MCEFIIDTNIAPGYGCCRCRVYNGFQRIQCKSCGVDHCALTVPDGQLAIYDEDGGSTKVKVLSVATDREGYGFELEAIEPLTESPLMGTIEPGEKWSPWAAYNAGAYGGMWRLRGVD